MRAMQFLHNGFLKSSIKIDPRIIQSLCACISGLLACQQAMVVAIGRSIPGQTKIKHKIKRADRLLSNKRLQESTLLFYQWLTHQLINKKKKPIILVDWSGLTPCGQYHVLRASAPLPGRALTLLELVYPEKLYGSPTAHQQFLMTLKSILPRHCCPIIVTDAGFRGPWFKLLQQFEWDFIGRVRNLTHCRSFSSYIWRQCKVFYKQATRVPKHLGRFYLAKSNPIECEFYLIKNGKKNRIKKNLKGKKVRCSVSKKHEKREQEPWLLATSLRHERLSAKKVVKIYKLRMTIEESFRDMKNTRHGLGYRHSRTLNPNRIKILLLIILFCMFIIWILGYFSKRNQWGRTLQTNSITSRNVLSLFFIGAHFIRNQYRNLTKADWRFGLLLVCQAVIGADAL